MTYLRLGIAVGILLALIGTFFYGRSAGIDHQRAADAAAMTKAVQAMEKAKGAVDAVSGEHAEVAQDQQATVREVYHEALKIVDRPVFHNVCMDADASRLLDDARANANRALTGEPVGGAGATAADPAQP